MKRIIYKPTLSFDSPELETIMIINYESQEDLLYEWPQIPCSTCLVLPSCVVKKIELVSNGLFRKILATKPCDKFLSHLKEYHELFNPRDNY